jgi:hypothetical protein
LVVAGIVLLALACTCAASLRWFRSSGSLPGADADGGQPTSVAGSRGVAAGSPADAVAAEVRRLKDPQLTYKLLRAELLALAERGDGPAVETLLALSAEQFQEDLVMEAMAQVGNAQARPRVAEHLRAKFAGRPIPQIRTALHSYRLLLGEACVAELQRFMRANRARPDGCGEQLCGAAAEELGALGTPPAQAALIAELDRVSEPGWLPDYGSTLVAVLAEKRNRTPAVSEALSRYADGLARKMPPADDPNGRKYIEDKVAEARAVADGNFRMVLRSKGGAR